MGSREGHSPQPFLGSQGFPDGSACSAGSPPNPLTPFLHTRAGGEGGSSFSALGLVM